MIIDDENDEKAQSARSVLPGKRQLFVEHYLKIGEGKSAALAAGYSEKTAAVLACEIL